jgi:hypothetical protein
MNRVDFQELAEERLQDAEALLTGGRWSGAYYMAGYAVECALKAVIAKRTVADDFPARNAAKLYTHNLKELLFYAGLGTARGAITVPGVTAGVASNWEDVRDWSEQNRYQVSRTEREAVTIVTAIRHPTEGVLQWLRTHWQKIVKAHENGAGDS